MPIVTLRDLYLAELQDLSDAEQQILEELPRMAAAATSSALRQAFEDHHALTRIHAERVELLLRKLDAQEGAPCQAVSAMIAEARRRIAEAERGDVLDAALIGIAQRIEHYEIAAYGCARSYAQTLGDEEAAKLLQQTLGEEGDADALLSRIAAHGINEAAGEDLVPDAERQRERLRYIAASRLREFKYCEFRIRNTEGEDLGSLDGVIVEERSHLPKYFVVDSGGWFVGQRFVIPIDALQPDDESKTLRTALDRKSIEAYPPFNPDAYLSLDAPASEDTRAGDDTCQPPSWLVTGVWMTEASGFASVPPRADADFEAPPAEQKKSAKTPVS